VLFGQRNANFDLDNLGDFAKLDAGDLTWAEDPSPAPFFALFRPQLIESTTAGIGEKTTL